MLPGPGGLRPASVSRALRRLGAPSWLVAAALVALALAGWWLSPRPAGQQETGQGAGVYELSGTVVAVADGDTVTLQAAGGRRRIRLASIDAPESGGRDRPGQPFGRAAGRHLAQLLSGQPVRARCYERDQYERDVCDLLLPDGASAGLRQVEAGMAWANMQGGGRYMRDDRLPELERQARQAGRGLWSQAGAVEPWVWRYRCWNQKEC